MTAVKLTADTVTDEQIRELQTTGDVATRRLCKVALGDAPTYLRASVIRDARAPLLPRLPKQVRLTHDKPDR